MIKCPYHKADTVASFAAVLITHAQSHRALIYYRLLRQMDSTVATCVDPPGWTGKRDH